MNRQIIKSESAKVKFEELDFEIPSNTQKGILCTIDGIIDRSVDGLSQDQPVRKHVDFELYTKIEEIIAVLNSYRNSSVPFTISIDDPSGNSYIENLMAPNNDPKLKTVNYDRTKEQNLELGLAEETENQITEEVHVFPGNCSRCNYPSDTKMHMLDIPHFKEVIIMSTICDSCGYKSNEVKSGGEIPAKGKRIELKITEVEDLSRDILKSETCSLRIPEIELELTSGTLGGRFTTVEGLLTQVKEELSSQAAFGDSATEQRKQTFLKFLDKIDMVLIFETGH